MKSRKIKKQYSEKLKKVYEKEFSLDRVANRLKQPKQLRGFLDDGFIYYRVKRVPRRIIYS